MIKLGSVVKDSVTGFKGIAVCRTTWLHGCARIGIEPQELKDGKTIDPLYFDEPRVVLIKEPKDGAFGMPSEKDTGYKTGGPQKDEGRFKTVPQR